MDGQKQPLVVSPDVFCTPAVQKYDGMGCHRARGAADGRGEDVVCEGKRTLGWAGERRPSTPSGSILAVRDQNTLISGTRSMRPASVKRVSFKVAPVTSPVARVARTEQGQLIQPAEQHCIASPGPWSQLMDDMGQEQSFTNYLNPLAAGADGDEREVESLERQAQQCTPVSQLSRAVDMATRQDVAFHMQTPEAVQVLHKISLHGKGRVDASSLDGYLRTGPKKLSPEPGMILGKDFTSYVNDEENDRADTRVALESSEDENVVDEGVEEGADEGAVQGAVQGAVEAQRQRQTVFVASPIGPGGEHMGDAIENTDLDEVPPTFQMGRGQKTIGRMTSPVRFSLLGESPASFRGGAHCVVARESKETGSNEKSFSFGMGGQGGFGGECAQQGVEVTAQLERLCSEDDLQSQDESVDQPNPFGAMLGRLRQDPVQLQSPVVGAIIKESVLDGSLAGSPESPANCTPMNLISTSSAASLHGTDGEVTEVDGGGAASDVEPSDLLAKSSSLEDWMRQRGIKHVSTPTRLDLQKMWSALENIRETTGAYEHAMRENAQLREELWETREAELDALADLDEALEAVRIEQERSRDAASKMADLAISMHNQFALLEEERRQLQHDLDEARRVIDASVDDGVANVMEELDELKAELEHLREAEEAARMEAISAREVAKALEERLALDADNGIAAEEVSLGDATDDAAEIATDDADVEQMHRVEDQERSDVQLKVEYFEGLHLEAHRGIKDPVDDPGDGLFDAYQNGAGELPECPHTGLRAPQTTPVDADDTTTPYRIHIEAMNQFRGTWETRNDAAVDIQGTCTRNEVGDTTVAIDTVVGDAQEPLEDTASDSSDYEAEDIVVSPIDVEDLTRANLRQTVMQRIAAVKSDLATAKSRLSHAQTGFKGRAVGAKVTVQSPIVVEASQSSDEDEELVPDEPPSLEEQDNTDRELAQLPRGGVEDQTADLQPTPASHRSIFARRLDAMSTPLSVRRAVFTPKTGMSALKSTAHVSPRFSSASSSATLLPPAYLQQQPTISRHQRARRFGAAREPSLEEDREFRRRAAALNIHVSPYMKRAGRRQMALN